MIREHKQTIQQGYEKFVIKNPDGCWGWTGCKSNPGYGQFRFNMKRERAHRASWIINFGEIPKGMFVLHKCDNRICSNPEHLFLGTNLDNIKDMISKKRHSYIGAKGSKNHMAKLTEKQVLEIRRRLSMGETNTSLAKEFFLHYNTILDIKNKSIWRNL